MTVGGATEPDADGVQAAIDRYRDLAKYLVGIFAAVGALLVAGTQLSSIGQLSWGDERARLIASALALATALVAVVWVVRRALDVLQPVDLSLEEIGARDDLRSAIERTPGLLGGAQRVDALAALIKRSQTTSAAERKRWRRVSDGVVDRASYLEMQRRFDRAWREMVAAVAVGAIAIAVLAWAANPPEKEKGAAAGPTAAAVPVAVLVDLTDSGRDALSGALGKACREPIAALVIGGSQSRPQVVTTALGNGCRPAQFVLDPAWGHARGLRRAWRTKRLAIRP